LPGSELDEDAKRQWRYRTFASVASLGDIEFQRATWLDPDMQNPAYTFVEFFEVFYDANAGEYEASNPEKRKAPFNYQVRQNVLSSEERDIMWPVHLEMAGYETADDYDHAQILADPAWHRVVATAATATSALQALLKKPEERAALENHLPSPDAKHWP